MKKRVISAILFLLAIGLVSSASPTLGGVDGFAPGEEVNLIQVCSNCTFVNITTVRLGDGELERINDVMTKDDTFYNFSLASNLTTSLGEYIVNWDADPDGVRTAGNFNFYIRNNGTLLTTAESVLYIFLALFNLIAVVLLLFYGITLPYNDEKTKDGTVTRVVSTKYLKLLSIWLGYGALRWLMSIITLITNNFVSLESARTLMTNLNSFLEILAYPLTIAILGIIMIEVYIDMFVPLFKKFFMNRTKKRARR